MGITSKNASAGLSVATPRRMCEVHMKEKKKSLDGSIRTRRDEKVNQKSHPSQEKTRPRSRSHTVLSHPDRLCFAISASSARQISQIVPRKSYIVNEQPLYGCLGLSAVLYDLEIMCALRGEWVDFPSLDCIKRLEVPSLNCTKWA